MDSKYVRTTVENLLAELEKNPAIGRRMSPSFMSRYGRPLGLGIALGVSGAVGCGDVLPDNRDAYGVGMLDAAADTRDALPIPIDAYGMVADRPADTRDALSPDYDAYVRPLDTGRADLYGVSRPDSLTDTRDALPIPIDAYGMVADRPADTRDALSAADTKDAAPAPDAGADALPDEGDAD